VGAAATRAVGRAEGPSRPLTVLQLTMRNRGVFLCFVCSALFLGGSRNGAHSFQVPSIANGDGAKRKPCARLQFDGGVRPNPGGASGCGWVLRDVSGREIITGSAFLGAGCSMMAEYQGLIRGLQSALDAGITELDVAGDSLNVIEQVQGKEKLRRSSDNLEEFRNAARDLAGQFERITFTHVSRDENKRADNLATKAILGAPRGQGELLFSGRSMDLQQPLLLAPQTKLLFCGYYSSSNRSSGCGWVLQNAASNLELNSGSASLGGSGAAGACNLMAEYEGLLQGLRAAKSAGISELEVSGYTKSVVEDVQGTATIRSKRFQDSRLQVSNLAGQFKRIAFTYVHRKGGQKKQERAYQLALDASRKRSE
jgi:ribonuclease HI